MTEEFFEFKRYFGEIDLNRNKTRGIVITITISPPERDSLLRIKSKAKRLNYYLAFIVERENRHFFLCHLDNIHIKKGGRLFKADMRGTALNPNEFERMEELFGIWEGILWETIHGIIVQGTSPEDVRNFGYAYLTLNEENKTLG